MTYHDSEYLRDVPCARCSAVGTVEWRKDSWYCKSCGRSWVGMVPVAIMAGDGSVARKEWRGLAFTE
jgi:hypothetical protein